MGSPLADTQTFLIFALVLSQKIFVKKVNVSRINSFFISAKTTQNYEVIIYNALGKEVLQKVVGQANSEEQISLEGIATGVYYVTIHSGSSSSTKKLLVK